LSSQDHFLPPSLRVPALDIASKYELRGLQAAYNNKAFLPGIAAAILLPPLLKSANEQK
jgi:hypothetical protein